MGVPVGRPGVYQPVQGGAKTILDSGTATLTTGGSVTVTTSTPVVGNILNIHPVSTISTTTTSVGTLVPHLITSGTSFRVKSSKSADRRKIYWEIVSFS